jgi:hypothetical protein
MVGPGLLFESRVFGVKYAAWYPKIYSIFWFVRFARNLWPRRKTEKA